MKIFPAIDLYRGKAVRLLRGEYDKVTVYSSRPEEKAAEFYDSGAEYLHVVDLEGARDGGTPNLGAVERIVRRAPLKVELGGGVRSVDVIERYLDLGVFRVILGTAAITQPGFTAEAIRRFGREHIAVGVDVKDGFVAIRGWTELSEKKCLDFCRELEDVGVSAVICTDVSRDGLLSGTNMELYKELSAGVGMELIASGGVTTLEDVRGLRDIGMTGAIIGKSLYTGGIDLREAIAAAEERDDH